MFLSSSVDIQPGKGVYENTRMRGFEHLNGAPRCVNQNFSQKMKVAKLESVSTKAVRLRIFIFKFIKHNGMSPINNMFD